MSRRAGDIDPDVLMAAFERHDGPGFSVNDRSITPAFVRGLLSHDRRNARYVMLKLAVPLELDDSALMLAWWRGIYALQSLSLTYGWGSKQRKARFRELATDAVLLHAIQGAAAMGERVPRDMLAVLVADGSDASIDALIPHIGNALDNLDARLEWLRTLRTHAADTPRVRVLLAELDATYSERNAKSPALALGPIIGIGEVSELWFWAWFSTEIARAGQVHVRIDSRKASWLTVSASSQHARSAFGVDPARDEDQLELGRCEPHELPDWIARVGNKLGVEWYLVPPRTNLRGKKREQLIAWLTRNP